MKSYGEFTLGCKVRTKNRTSIIADKVFTVILIKSAFSWRDQTFVPIVKLYFDTENNEWMTAEDMELVGPIKLIKRTGSLTCIQK